MVNQLKNIGDGFPFKFFTEESFTKEDIVENVLDCYEVLNEDPREPIVASEAMVLRMTTIYQLGLIARVCDLGERLPPSLFTPSDAEEYIRELYDYFGNIHETLEAYSEEGFGLPMDEEMKELFTNDIESVFDMYRVSHFRGPYFYSTYDNLTYDGKKVSAELFRNALFNHVPIVRVW